MYVRTESGEIIEVHDNYHYPNKSEMVHVARAGYHHEFSSYCQERYGKLYLRPVVKPVDGVQSWQLLSKPWCKEFSRFDEDGKYVIEVSVDVCIATFDTVKEANQALGSFMSHHDWGGGWDAIEYKKEMNARIC